MSFLLSRLIGSSTPSAPSPTSSTSPTSKGPLLSPSSGPSKAACKYHLRVLLRGDKETGKSALLRRLQGGGFIEQHVLTPQLVATNIHWTYKTSEDTVDIEVWDVVDKAAPKKTTPATQAAAAPASTTPAASTPDTPSTAKSKQTAALPPAPVLSTSGSSSSSSPSTSIPVDAASCPDLYSSAHAVIFLIDPSRDWTFSYCKSALPLVPRHVDVLLLLNFRDLPDSQRVVTDSHVQQFMRTQPANVKYLECSMKNGYGLKTLHLFFNLPFLHVKASKLRDELKAMEVECDMAASELELMSEMDYSSYLKWLSTQVAEREKGLSDEEKKVEAEKRIQQERLMILLAEEKRKEDDKKAEVIRKEHERQQKELQQLEEDNKRQAAKAAKKSKASHAARPATSEPAPPSLLIDKAKERLELEHQDLGDFVAEASMDDFFGEPKQQLSEEASRELKARQDRTRPAEETQEEEEGQFVDEEELDQEADKAAPRLEAKEAEDEDVLDEPDWELDTPTAYASPFGVQYGVGPTKSTQSSRADEEEKEKKKVKEKEREREKALEADKAKAQQAERKEKERQKLRAIQERAEREKQERRQRELRDQEQRSDPLPAEPPTSNGAQSGEDDDAADDTKLTRRPAKSYSFAEDDDLDAPGPVFDDDDDGQPPARRAEARARMEERAEDADVSQELAVAVGGPERKETLAKDALDASQGKKEDRWRAEASVLLNPAAQGLVLPRLDLTEEEEAKLTHEAEERERREREKANLIIIPTSTAPLVPDADLDIFGAAGGNAEDDKPRARDKAERNRRSEATPKISNDALAGFYDHGSSANSSHASSAVSSAKTSPRPSKHRSRHKVKRSSDSSASDEDDEEHMDQAKHKPKDKLMKRKGRTHGEERLEDDLDLDVQVDVAAEIERAKKEREQREREARAQQIRKDRKAQPKPDDPSSDSDERRARRRDKGKKAERNRPDDRHKEKEKDAKKPHKQRRDASSSSDSSPSSSSKHRKKKKDKKKQRAASSSSSSDSSVKAKQQPHKKKKKSKRGEVDAFYEDDEYSGRKVATVPVSVSVMGMGPEGKSAMSSAGSKAAAKSSGFSLSNLLRGR